MNKPILYLFFIIITVFGYNTASATVTVGTVTASAGTTNGGGTTVAPGTTFTIAATVATTTGNGTLSVTFFDNNNTQIGSTQTWPTSPSSRTYTSITITAPTTPGNYTYTINGSASTGGGRTASNTIVIIVVPTAPAITYSSTSFVIGSAVSLIPSNSGGDIPAVKTYSVSTFASSGFNHPSGLASDASGNLYVADRGNNNIKKITPSGGVTVFAGSTSGANGTTNGTGGTTARFDTPFDIASDPSGNLYVADNVNNIIRKITPAGIVSNLDGITAPTSITYDVNTGYLFVTSGNRVYKVAKTGTTSSVFAGTTGAGRTNNNGTAAKFSTPVGITSDASGNFYIADQVNNEIREIAPNADVTLFAGSTGGTAGTTDGTTTGARFSAPQGIAIDPSGNLYVADNGNDLIRFITPAGVVSTILGTGDPAYIDGYGTSAAFSDPRNLAVDPSTGYIYVPDYGNNVIRKIAPSGYTISPALPAGLSMDPNTGIISGTPTTLSTNTYTINAINGGGISTTSLTITVTAPVAPTITGGGVSACANALLLASTGTPSGGTYNWYTSSGSTTPIFTSTSPSYNATASGTYYVTYSSGGFESVKSTGVSLTVGSGTGPVLSTAPTSGSLYLSYSFTGNATDISGHSNTGLVGATEGTPALTTDRFGAANSAYSFNGTNQYVATTTSQTVSTTQSFSLSIWFKTNTAGGRLIGYGTNQTGSSGSYDRHIYMDDSGNLYFGIYPNAVQIIQTTGTNYADNTWHHVVATFSNANGSSLYVDGALKDSNGSMNVAQNYSPGWWRIGYDNNGGWTNQPSNFFFKGSLDDVAVYSTELSADQVGTLYGASSSATCVGNPLILRANTVSGATYSWTGPNGFTSNQQNAVVTNSATSAYDGLVYTLTVTSPGGCSTSINVTTKVNAALTAPTISSSNSGALYTFNYTGGLTATWDFNGGTILSGSGNGPYQVEWGTATSKTVTLTVINSSGCSAVATTTFTPTAASFGGGYAFSRTVTFKSSSSALATAIAGNTFTNFPALLSIQSDDLKSITALNCVSAKVFNPTGLPNPTNVLDYDFAFVSQADGSELNYQVESYNSSTGTLLVWVRIPSLTHTDYPMTFYYGSKTATHTAAFHQATWASDYQAVYHFTETPSNTNPVIDATSSPNNGVSVGLSSVTTGMIGNAYTFDGSTSKITLSAGLTSVTSNFTISAWVKINSLSNDQKVMTNQGSGGSNTNGFKLGVYSNNIPETEEGGSVNRGQGTIAPALNGNWHYLQGVYDASAKFMYTYVDGQPYQKFSNATAPTASNPFYIGVGEGGTKFYFNGIIDEPRVSTQAKSTNWLAAEYANQFTGGPTTYTGVGTTLVVNGTAAATIPGAATYTWNGSISTDPTVAGNWYNTTGGTNVAVQAIDFTSGNATIIIPAGLSKYPALSAPGSIYGLTLAAGASINLNGYTLSVGCNIINSSGGQILYGGNSASGLTWIGTTAQTYTGANTAGTATVGNMTVNSGATVTINGGPIDVYTSLNSIGTLTVGASPAALTLKSNAVQTAFVPKVTGSINGNVNVERYMSGGVGRRGYRLLSSPVFTTTFGSPSVRAYTLYSLQATTPITGWGTGATYTLAQPNPAAFDNSTVGNPSALFYYEPDADPAGRVIANSDYKALNTISDALPIGNGFLFFFRGNRSLLDANGVTKLSTGAVPENTTLSNSGVLNQGDVKVYIPTAPLITYSGNTKVYSQATANGNLSTAFSYTAHTPASSNDGFHLVGNPYAATIDLDKLLSLSLFTNPYTSSGNNYIYALNNNGSFGSYMLGSGGAVSTANITRFILPGQGFFVRGLANATLTFTEDMKVSTGITPPASFAIANNTPTPMQVLRVMLALDSNNNNETLIQFGYNKANNKYSDKEDAAFITGPTQTTYLTSYSSDNKPCLINQMSTLDSVKSIVLYAEGPTTGRYTFTFSGAQSLDPRYKLYLKDNLLKDSLDLSANTTYAFNIDRANTQTYGDKRFSIVVYPTHIADLYQLTTFKGIKNNNSVTLNWKTVYEGNYTGFKVQRSVDGGKTFVTIGDLQSDGSGNYSFTDTNPMLDAANQYKIAQNNINNVNSFSDVITISYLTVDTKTNKLQVFPNPVASIINVAIKTDKDSGPLVVKVFSVMGELMMTSTFTQNSSLSMDVGNLMKGAYVIQVSDNNKNYGSATFTKL